MSAITIELSEAPGAAMRLSVDSATGEVVGEQNDGLIKSVNLEEWAKVYPGVDITQASALNIRDFAYVASAGEFCPPDWEYRQNRLIKGEVSVIDINGYDNYELNPCVLLGANNQPVPYHDPAGGWRRSFGGLPSPG